MTATEAKQLANDLATKVHAMEYALHNPPSGEKKYHCRGVGTYSIRFWVRQNSGLIHYIQSFKQEGQKLASGGFGCDLEAYYAKICQHARTNKEDRGVFDMVYAALVDAKHMLREMY